jgi:hypothetical protein
MIRVPSGILKYGKVLVRGAPGGPLTGMIRKRIENRIEPLGDESDDGKKQGIVMTLCKVG